MPKVIKGSGAPSSKPQRKAIGASRGRGGKKQVIPAEIVGANQEARRIKQEALEDAQKIRERAEAEAEATRERGYNEGYEQAMAEYTQKAVEGLSQLEQFKSTIEPDYVHLVRTCVEKILGQELRLNPDAIVGIVRNTLKNATQQREVNVRVNPADVEMLRKNQRKLLDVLARANMIEIREDEAVERGGCIVVTELGTIDATLDRQLSAIEDALKDELDAAMAGVGGTARHAEPEAEYEEEYEEEYE